MLNELPLFFQNEDHQLFGVIHEPEITPLNKAFVFCHAFAEEKLWSHRVYVSFARELAALGYTVLRFDYQGYGDSEGEFSKSTIDSMINDIKAGIHYLCDTHSELLEVGLVGHRLGATAALIGLESFEPTGPVILWDPIIDGDRYIQDFLRSHLATQMAVYGEIRETREVLLQTLKNGDYVNIDGYDLSMDVYESIRKTDLKDLNGISDLNILLVQVGRNDTPKKDYEHLASLIGADLRCVKEDPFWREIKRFYYSAPNISKATLDWIRS